MSNPVELCNRALSQVGGNYITSLSDSQVEARICNLNYDSLRRTMQETGNFAFAVDRRRWATPLATPPEWGYSYAFNIPSDVFKVIRVRRDSDWRDNSPDAQVDFNQVGNEIHTNESVILVTVAMDVSNTNLFSHLFSEAFVARLAAEICIALTDNGAQYQRMYALYEEKMREATSYDNQLVTKNNPRTTRLITARYSSGLGIGRR